MDCTSILHVSKKCDKRPHMKRRQMQVKHNLKSIATRMTAVDYVPCRLLHPHLCVLCLHPRLSCSLNHLFRYPHVPSTVCRLFRYPHVPSIWCQLCPIFLHPHVPSTVCRLFRYPHVPPTLCRLCPIFLHPHVPSTVCRLFRYPHVSTIFCLLFFYSVHKINVKFYIVVIHDINIIYNNIIIQMSFS